MSHSVAQWREIREGPHWPSNSLEGDSSPFQTNPLKYSDKVVIIEWPWCLWNKEKILCTQRLSNNAMATNIMWSWKIKIYFLGSEMIGEHRKPRGTSGLHMCKKILYLIYMHTCMHTWTHTQCMPHLPICARWMKNFHHDQSLWCADGQSLYIWDTETEMRQRITKGCVSVCMCVCSLGFVQVLWPEISLMLPSFLCLGLIWALWRDWGLQLIQWSFTLPRDMNETVWSLCQTLSADRDHCTVVRRHL